MLWDYCIVLCIYEHGHDNVVRRLCGNIDHGIVDEPVDTSQMHFMCGLSFIPEHRGIRDREKQQHLLPGAPGADIPRTPAVFTLPST